MSQKRFGHARSRREFIREKEKPSTVALKRKSGRVEKQMPQTNQKKAGDCSVYKTFFGVTRGGTTDRL